MTIFAYIAIDRVLEMPTHCDEKKLGKYFVVPFGASS